jgi:biotin carboxyl carrier protein
MQFHAILDDQEFALTLDGDEITLDGQALDAHVHRLSDHTYHLLVDRRSYVMTVERLDGGRVRVTHQGHTQIVQVKDERALLLERMGISADASHQATELRAPMPGLVLQVHVADGQEVSEGDALLVLEAMKMENELRAGAAGTVATVHVAPGDAVTKNDLLVSFAAA